MAKAKKENFFVKKEQTNLHITNAASNVQLRFEDEHTFVQARVPGYIYFRRSSRVRDDPSVYGTTSNVFSLSFALSPPVTVSLSGCPFKACVLVKYPVNVGIQNTSRFLVRKDLTV